MNENPDWQALYPEGCRREFEPPEIPVWALLERAAREHPERPAVRFGDLTVSYEHLRRQTLLASAQLRSRAWGRARPGDRVLLWLPNCPEFVSHYYGAMRAGLIVAAASPKLSAEELTPILREIDPSAALVEEALFPAFYEAARLAGIKTPRAFPVRPGEDFRRADDRYLLESILEPPPAPKVRPGFDVAALQFTSGTTGGLKAAMMSHRNLVANALQNNHWFGWTHDDVILGALPLCHTWGTSCVMHATIAAGACMALIEHFEPRPVLDAIEDHGITVAYGSGTMFQRLLDAAGNDAPEIFKGLRYVKAGAMLIDRSLNQRWSKAVPGVPMINGYGLTEASPEVCNNPPSKPKVGTAGLPLPGTKLRLCNPEEPEREVEAGGEGEIQVRGPQVMLGYWSRPGETRQTLLPGGWLRTGDVGRFDAEGYLKIVDRLKDLIKFRGFSVTPSEVERVLLTHPSVLEAVVVGMPDAQDGEVPVAFLVLHPGAPLDTLELPRYVEPHLASFKRPRRYHIVHEIPKNAVGKPLKRVLREMPEPGTGPVRLP